MALSKTRKKKYAAAVKKTAEGKKTVVARKAHTFEIINYSDGTATWKRRNDGFSVTELVGIATIIQQDMLELLRGALKQSLPVADRKAKNAPLIHKKGS